MKTDWMERVKALALKGVCHVRLSEDQWSELRNRRAGVYRFSLIFPHAVANKAKAETLALFTGDGVEIHIGIVSSISAVASLDSRVVFDQVQPVVPTDVAELVDRVAAVNCRLPVNRLREGSEELLPLSEKLREMVFEQFVSEAANEVAFTRILARVDRPRRFDGTRALQSDAIGLALKAFGFSGGASSITLPGKGSSLESVRVLEDAAIEHDARWIPGWDLENSDITGKAVFTQGNDSLVVYTANKRPLEELLGVDLIYLNETRESLIMVQYKMMEARSVSKDAFEGEIGALVSDRDGDQEDAEIEEREWAAPIDLQFKNEMERMAKFDTDLAPDGPYRLNSGAFYFKFVRRNAARNSPTLVISLGHLRQMMEKEEVSGPRGGLRVSYKELGGHYLRGDGFIELVRSGYIGSHGATTTHLKEIIEETLANRRGVVAAIQSAVGRARQPKQTAGS
ncbi:MAG: hypothetical protein ACOH1R_07610 [Luteimonas sp.]